MQVRQSAEKPRLAAIEFIRGVSMMGVIAIHVGSQYIVNPSANAWLVAVFEVASRFSVPIFFFISAFGLFYNLDTTKPFSYGKFLKKRMRAVLLPYLIWSFFYLGYDDWFYNAGFPPLSMLFSILLFGLAKYQLYFLVILIGFYLLMPLWIWCIKHMHSFAFILLLAAQVAFDYWSSYSISFNTYVYALPDGFYKSLLLYRLNWLVLHYIFIFLFGGWLAVHFEAFLSFLKKRLALLASFFCITLLWLNLFYFQLIRTDHYSLIEAINTAHQLSPPGIFYTIAASLFLFGLFTYGEFPTCIRQILHLLGRHSYFAYLVHPVFIGYLATWLTIRHITMTASIACAFYTIVLFLSVLSAMIFRQLGNKLPLLNLLLIGIYNKKK